VPRRSAYSLAWRILCAIPTLALCLALAGCISTPLEDRDWVRVQTSHYEIWSSLPAEDSAHLAIDLEHFRAATAYLAKQAIPAQPIPTRVYAFDDRGIGRPFAHEAKRAYLLPRQPGDVIVLRTGGGWGGDAWTDFKLEYARRLLWNASPDNLPPWLDEGLPQLASTLETRTDGATAGAPPKHHLRDLRDNQWISFERLLGETDLAGWSGLEREILAAESWALCHYLTFGGTPKVVSDDALMRYRNRVAAGAEPVAVARTEFGDLGKLQHEVWRVIRGTDFIQGNLKIDRDDKGPRLEHVKIQQVLEELGGLAIAIGNQDRATKFLEDAQEIGPGSARGLASSGDLLEANGDRAGAEARYDAALAAAPDDAVIHARFANLLRARAEDEGDPAQRAEFARLARSHYAQSIEWAPRLAESHAGIAATFLVDGEDPSGALAHARTAHGLLPGDPEIALLSAKLELAHGDREAARRTAIREVTRARSAPDLEAARSVLAQIDEHASIH
jgi:tetratricopeptide (TPR) repeat protein